MPAAVLNKTVRFTVFVLNHNGQRVTFSNYGGSALLTLPRVTRWTPEADVVGTPLLIRCESQPCFEL
jgi:hypothetical protein